MVVLFGLVDFGDGFDATTSNGNHTTILLDEPVLHLLKVVLDESDFCVALSDGSVLSR